MLCEVFRRDFKVFVLYSFGDNMIRDLKYLQQTFPCDVDIYNSEITSIADARAAGPNPCPNKVICDEKQRRGGRRAVACTLLFGKYVAKFTAQGSTLDAEMEELDGSGLFDGATFTHSEDRKTFKEITGPAEIFAAVRSVAERLLE